MPVQGVSAALTMTKLQAANDLNNMVPLPNSRAEPARAPSPQIVKGVLAGAESEMDSSSIDSGDEWDKTKASMWQHHFTLTAKSGLICRGTCHGTGRGSDPKPRLN